MRGIQFSIRARERGSIQLYTSNNARLYKCAVGLLIYRSLVVRGEYFSYTVTAQLGLNATRESTRSVHLSRGQQIQFFFYRGSYHPSALIRDIHLSAGGEFFSIFNLIVLSAYTTSILEF